MMDVTVKREGIATWFKFTANNTLIGPQAKLNLKRTAQTGGFASIAWSRYHDFRENNRWPRTLNPVRDADFYAFAS